MDVPAGVHSFHPLSWVTKIFGFSTVILTVAMLGGLAVGGYYGHRLYTSQIEMRADTEAIKANLRILNERSVVGEIIDEQLARLPADTRSRVAQEIYDGGRRYGIPYHIALSVITHESRWDPDVVSPMGAVGLGQLMPDMAIFIAKSEGVPFTLAMLHDPVINARWTMIALGLKHEVSIMQGKSNREDWVQALWYYSGKGEKYARETISESVVYRRRLDAPLQGKLPPTQ